MKSYQYLREYKFHYYGSLSKIKANSKMYQERMSYFIKNKMQRRHMMANTLFLNQTNSY